MKQLIVGLVFLCGMMQHVTAQRVFSEGILRYDVFVNNSEQPDGVYIVTIKNGFIKRELAMHSGYNNIVLYNHSTGISTSLSMDQDVRYALQMSASELQERNKKFEHAVFTENKEKKKIAGFACKSTSVKYADGEVADLFFTPDLLPPNDFFLMMFPGLKGIPLEYEVASNATLKMKFKATVVETKSIDSNLFNIPKEYKIVTKEELEKMK